MYISIKYGQNEEAMVNINCKVSKSIWIGLKKKKSDSTNLSLFVQDYKFASLLEKLSKYERHWFRPVGSEWRGKKPAGQSRQICAHRFERKREICLVKDW